MIVVMLTRYSPHKGQRLEAGARIDVDDEVALDLIQRGIARPVRQDAERAVAPGQTGR